MIAIDTNVLVRYLTNDDEIQSYKASQLLSSQAGSNNSIFINNIVICELIWVLERGYKYSKQQVTSAIKEILATVEFSFENHKILWTSIIEYEKSKADFSDILIGKLNISKNCTCTFTFDIDASTLSTFTLIN